MTFTIDTAERHVEVMVTTHGVDDTQRIVITSHKRAQPLFNKIKENIEAHEDQDDLDAYMARESLTIDALHLFDPHVSAELQDIYETHRACLVHGGVARRTQSGNPAQNAQDGKDGNDKEYW